MTVKTLKTHITDTPKPQIRDLEYFSEKLLKSLDKILRKRTVLCIMFRINNELLGMQE